VTKRSCSETFCAAAQPCCVYSVELLGEDRELLILHRGDLYRLRWGVKGRLELVGPEQAEGEREGPVRRVSPGG